MASSVIRRGRLEDRPLVFGGEEPVGPVRRAAVDEPAVPVEHAVGIRPRHDQDVDLVEDSPPLAGELLREHERGFAAGRLVAVLLRYHEHRRLAVLLHVPARGRGRAGENKQRNRAMFLRKA